ncbi:MAG: DHH family phosphoesterase [Bacteroidetes bacterium]|nr:DHH family phosphoesterase [Bacteroidota bacterium]
MQSISQLFPLLQEPRKVIITTHQKPDPDAMGSSLGLYHFLQSFGHEVQVISPTNWAAFLDWMPGCDKVLDFETQQQAAVASIQQSDWIFCLDFNALSRTKKMAPLLENAKAKKILIDHHREPQTTVFEWGISDIEKSSTSEMIYDFIVQSGHADRINDFIMSCLYAGVMGDTGSFRFASATAGVHEMIASFKRNGLQHTRIHELIYDNYLENRYRFIGHVLSHRLEVIYELNVALIWVSKQDLLKFQIKTGDTEGLVNYPLGIQGIKVAALLIDRDEKRKWSFRSKGTFDCNTFARRHFNGGGHFNAAGGESDESLEQNLKQFRTVLLEYVEQLRNY